MSKDFRKKKVTLEAPEYKPKLKFRSKEELKTYKAKMLFWSENRSENHPYGIHQDEFVNYLTTGELFHAFVMGETMEGKGVTIENLAEYYKENFEKFVIIDISGKNYEGCYWAKNYKCYLVYHQGLKPSKPSDNPNIIEKKLNHNNTWKKLIKLAHKNKRVLILMCYDPLDNHFLKAQYKLFNTLNHDESLASIRKVLLLREISFIGYKQGILKATTSKYALDVKREFLLLCRTGRHPQNQIIADAQRFQDIDSALGDNVALKIIKRTESFVGNYPKYIQDKIKTLEKHQAILQFRGKVFTAIIGYNEWHKTSKDKIEDLGIYPARVDFQNLNKFKENRYIDMVSEEWTNYNGRFILGRRRHIQNPEDTKLCSFELADLLGLQCNIELNGKIMVKKPKMIYGEIKFRSPGSKHPKIETGDVIKTIQDLAVKKITWNEKKNCYFWTLDQDILKSLNWYSEEDNFVIPTIVEMITPQGATTGAKALMKKHNIYLRIVKIDENFYD